MKTFFCFIISVLVFQNVFSQSDSARKRLFYFGVKTDVTTESFRKATDEGLRPFQAFEFLQGIISFDPALLVGFKKNSVSFGPKIFLINSDIYARGGKWYGIRANYQYTFDCSDKCNLFLFYEFAYAHYENEESGYYIDFVYGGATHTSRWTNTYINHEIGAGGRVKLIRNFYCNFSYGVGINFYQSYYFNQLTGELIDTIPYEEFNPYSLNRLTGFLRAGLQYDFHL